MKPVPPIDLDSIAQAFWDRHAGRLAEAGILTDADLDTFAVVCQCWSKVQALSACGIGADHFREAVQLNNMLKQFHSYAKQFGLLPQARKAAKMDAAPPPKKDEFGL